MPFQTFRNLIAWQTAMELVTCVYEFCRRLPDDERFGLTPQFRRAGVSVASNIAEGHGRRTPEDFANFLWIARRSPGEIESQALIAQRPRYATSPDTQSIVQQCADVGRVVRGLRASLEKP